MNFKAELMLGAEAAMDSDLLQRDAREWVASLDNAEMEPHYRREFAVRLAALIAARFPLGTQPPKAK